MTILQALVGHYDRLVESESGPALHYGYSMQGVSYAVVLSPEGEFKDVMDIRDPTGKSPRPKRMLVPGPVKRSVNVAPNFLWDKTAYSLGLVREEATSEPTPTHRGEHDAFKQLHLDLLAATDDKGLRALATFIATWNPDPEQFVDFPHALDMLDANIVFRLDGEMEFIHDSADARAIWQDHLAMQGGAEAFCLVTGEIAPVERLHPKIKGVRGAQSSGASIISFNHDAFESFGRKQGDNAPVSERAAFSYTTALNAMLTPNSGHNIRIGDTTVVYWAEASLGKAAALAAERTVSIFLDSPPTDDSEGAKVRYKLAAVSEGRPIKDVEPDVREDTRFYVLGFAPNASRLSVRFWVDTNLGALYQRFTDHWRDLRIEPTPRKRTPTVQDIANESARVITKADGSYRKQFDTVPPLLCGHLMRSLLTGQHYPRTLVSTIIMRIRADSHVSDLRIAALKAFIVRKLRLNKQLTKEDYLVSLDPSSTNIAYNLGRLFAAFAYAETSSRAERNATIRDKYMGAASSTPRRVFPILLRGYEHQRSSLAKSSGKSVGAGVNAEKAILEIMELLPGQNDLPASLPLEDQSRFFIGFYHQESHFYTKSTKSNESHQTKEQP